MSKKTELLDVGCVCVFVCLSTGKGKKGKIRVGRQRKEKRWSKYHYKQAKELL